MSSGLDRLPTSEKLITSGESVDVFTAGGETQYLTGSRVFADSTYGESAIRPTKMEIPKNVPWTVTIDMGEACQRPRRREG